MGGDGCYDPCDENPYDVTCTGGGGGEGSGDSGGNAGGNGPLPCPPGPPLPSSGIPANQLQQNISSANTVTTVAMLAGPAGALAIDAAYLTYMFLGPWNYKAQGYTPGTSDYQAAQDFGNFNFGAVMASLGLNYYLTQNAAGVAQIGICIFGAREK